MRSSKTAEYFAPIFKEEKSQAVWTTDKEVKSSTVNIKY